MGGRFFRRNSTSASDPPPLVDLLEAAGFWSAVDADGAAQLIEAARSGASPAQGILDHGWWADGEDLAEGDVGELLANASPALADEGVDLVVETVHRPHDPDSPGYTIRINGADLDLYRYDPDEPGLPTTEDPWMDCTVLPLHRVNELLDGVGSQRRMAVFSPGGNEGTAVLLSITAIEVLQTHPDVPAAERPVVP